MDSFTDNDEERLAALGITPESIAAFCAAMGSSPVGADEEFSRLKAHFHLSDNDCRFVLRYLEECGPT